jgi:ElaB/YqjD/DUF883 family membrane-anchored ribosome-binding protein
MNQMTEFSDDVGKDVRAEIDDLRAQVEKLLNEKVAPRLNSALAQAESVAQNVKEGAQHQAERVAGAVHESPLVALSMAALAGFAVAAMLRR